jgi:ubiquinone/menaquinone biosynthesis C-methylase UbiE
VNHDDHVRLIETGIGRGGGVVWADLGAGSGAFTLALRDVAGPEVAIVAVDRDRRSLGELRQRMDRQFPGTRLALRVADFTGDLDLPPLDGIVAANAIHFVHDQRALLQTWRGYLKPHGRLVVVEYAAERGNRWVPYPLSFAAFRELAPAAGFGPPTLIATRPSWFMNGMYGAVTSPECGDGRQGGSTR